MRRCLGGLDKRKFRALLIDATPFEGQQLVAAPGITVDGSKMILGIQRPPPRTPPPGEPHSMLGEPAGSLLTTTE